MKKTFNPIAAEQLDNLYKQLAESNRHMEFCDKNKQNAEEQGDEQLATYWKNQWRGAVHTGVSILDVIDALLATFERREVRL